MLWVQSDQKTDLGPDLLRSLIRGAKLHVYANRLQALMVYMLQVIN